MYREACQKEISKAEKETLMNSCLKQVQDRNAERQGYVIKQHYPFFMMNTKMNRHWL